MSVLSDETPAQTPIQSPTSGDTAGKFSGSSNDSPALQQSTPLAPAAATQAWLDSVPREKRERSDAYFEGGYWLLLWNYLVAAAISILLLSSKISARLRDFSEGLARSKTLQVACYSVPYLLLVYILSFPLNVYEHFFREHQYGLATQTFPAWFSEQLIGLAVTIVGGTIFLVVLYAVFRRAPKTWWIFGSIIAVVFSFVLVFVAPVFIEPLFNTYKRVTKAERGEAILETSRGSRITVTHAFDIHAPRHTTQVSTSLKASICRSR